MVRGSSDFRTRRSRKSNTVPRKTSAHAPAKRRNLALCVLLAAATIGLYIPTLGHSFLVWDDQDYVTANPYIHGGLVWSTIKWAFTSTAAANWHPLTWLSHALDYQLFGLSPSGHHLDSVLIHALNALLLFLVLEWVTKRAGPSLLVAALFSLHPINVESVAWVAERKNVLSTLFFLVTIAAYAWYAKRPDWRRYLLVAVLFAAGLMAKPMVITLPFVLLLLDYWPLDRALPGDAENPLPSSSAPPRMAFSRLLLEKVPLLALSAASAWITLKAQRTAVRTFEEFPLALRMQNAAESYALYLWKTLWPEHLAFYPHPLLALPPWQWILSSLMLTCVTVLVVILRRKRYLPVGWFWFLGTLIPVIGLVQVGEASMADRYAYIPLIGIFIMIAWSLADFAEAKRIGTAWQTIPVLCVLAVLGVVTFRQIGYWGSDYDLWSHALAVAEDPFAHNAIGAALMDPDSAMTQHDLENFDTEQKRIDEARRHFERAYEMRREMAQQDPERYSPYVAGALNNLGNVDRNQNRTDEARQHFGEALTIYRQIASRNPDRYLYYLATTLNNLGFLDRLQNRPDDARRHYEEALTFYHQLAQQNPDAYMLDMATMLNNLGNLDGRENRMDEARLHYEEALKSYSRQASENQAVYPDIATTLSNLGNVDLRQNRPDDAGRHFKSALEIYRKLAQQDPNKYQPFMAATLNTLGYADRNQNRIEQSRVHYQEAMAILRQLAQRDPGKYGGDVARIEENLKELDGKALSK